MLGLSSPAVPIQLGTAGSSAPKHPFIITFQVQWFTATLIRAIVLEGRLTELRGL